MRTFFRHNRFLLFSHSNDDWHYTPEFLSEYFTWLPKPQGTILDWVPFQAVKYLRNIIVLIQDPQPDESPDVMNERAEKWLATVDLLITNASLPQLSLMVIWSTEWHGREYSKSIQPSLERLQSAGLAKLTTSY